MNISKLVRSAKCGVLSALVAMGMTAVAADQEAVQLWAGGPYWATSNLGTSEVADHSEYGALYKFDDAGTAVKSLLGEEWRVPSKDDFDKLVDSSYCTKTWDSTKQGYTFTGATDGYKDKSIFLPAAGYDNKDSGRGYVGDNGTYWSSETSFDESAWSIAFGKGYASVGSFYRSYGMSVRAVRDTAPVTGPTVTVGEVKTGEPWSKITVNYTLGGTDAATDYKVAFDVTAKDQTASVTNDAAKLTDGAATKEIDTAQLFGKQVVDTKAKVKVTLIAIKPKLGGVQLWEDGPFFAECNVGANAPQDYGYYFWWGDTVGYKRNPSNDGWVSADGKGTAIQFSSSDATAKQTFKHDNTWLTGNKWIDGSGNLVVSDDAATNRDAARAHLGAPWRMMTKDELDKLVSTDYCQREWVDEYKGVTVNGWVVKGKAGSAYENNEVFFPAAGYVHISDLYDAGSRGLYWPSTPHSDDSDLAWSLSFNSSSSNAGVGNRYNGLPVRPVR